MIRLIGATGFIFCAAAALAQPPASVGKDPKIVGGAFDPVFQEHAPAGGLLIGFEISLGKFGNREVIRSLRPIYRTSNGEETNGTEYGVAEGKMYLAKAKAGYAVGGVKLRTGLLIDGMSVLFIKTDGSVLDRNDAYETAWIGNTVGGSPSTLAGDGTPVVGFAARVTGKNRECSGMGLILKDSLSESGETSANSPTPAGVPAGPPKLTRTNFERIEHGMTEKQVLAILGHPYTSSQRVAKVLAWRQIDRKPEGNVAIMVKVILQGGKVRGTNRQVINFTKP